MMNRGVLQTSLVQPMMATTNPSWWNLNNLMARPPIMAHHLGLSHDHNHDHDHQQFLLSPSSSTTTNLLNSNSCSNNNDDENNNNSTNNNISIGNSNNNGLFQAHHPYLNVNMSSTPPSSSSWLDDHIDLHQHQHQHHHLSESWSQFLMSGVCIGEEQDEVLKTKMGRWEDQMMLNQHTHHHQVKQEAPTASATTTMAGYCNSINNLYDTVAIANHDQKLQIQALKSSNNNHNNTWSSSSSSPIMNNNTNNSIPTSSPQSCVSTFSGGNCNSLLDFSSSKSSSESLHANHPTNDRSSECNSTPNGGAHKKAKVQQASTQSTFKVRKEKLGDRITALHQLVSPFGKTDTASVLLEAIGYIRFLQSQIEALSLPYLTNGAANKRQSHLVQGEKNCMFPEDPGQLLNDNCLKRKGGPDQDSFQEPKDLKSRGLCLVPVSCTLHVGSDNGADYWAPALGGGGGGVGFR